MPVASLGAGRAPFPRRFATNSERYSLKNEGNVNGRARWFTNSFAKPKRQQHYQLDESNEQTRRKRNSTTPKHQFSQEVGSFESASGAGKKG